MTEQNNIKNWWTSLNKVKRRIIIIYILVNVIALFTNYFQLPIGFAENKGSDIENNIGKYKYYVFTDASVRDDIRAESGLNYLNGKEKHFNQSATSHFYPFVLFYDSSLERFRGLFPDYDFTEFAFYISILLIMIFIKKLW